MLNSHWNSEFEKPELEKQSGKTGWVPQSSTPCPEQGFTFCSHPLLWRDPHPEGQSPKAGRVMEQPGLQRNSCWAVVERGSCHLDQSLRKCQKLALLGIIFEQG